VKEKGNLLNFKRISQTFKRDTILIIRRCLPVLTNSFMRFCRLVKAIDRWLKTWRKKKDSAPNSFVQPLNELSFFKIFLSIVY
jgi:hypothetical protein